MLGGLMNIWLRLQQTLYTKCISESVFGLLIMILFLAVEFFLLCKDPCLMLILLFPGKLLSSGQSQTQSVKTPPHHHHPPPRLSPWRRSDLPQRAV